MSESVPVDLDAVEERILAQWSLRSLAYAAAAALAGLEAFHATARWPVTAHVAAASVTAAVTWGSLSARFEGATLPVWIRRALVFALAPHRYAPARPHPRGGRSWRVWA